MIIIILLLLLLLIAVRRTSYKETLEHFEIGKVLNKQVKFAHELLFCQ